MKKINYAIKKSIKLYKLLFIDFEKGLLELNKALL